MTIAILLAWALTGALIARLYNTEWRRWTPISMIFGPLWLLVAPEQRQARIRNENA